jgi:hypothetical protein
MIIRPKHISVRNPQAPGPRSRSALCSRRRRYDARIPPIFADHLRSSVLCIQCRQARGGIPLVAISVRACMPGQRIFTSRMGVLVHVFLFRPHRGVSGDQPIRPPSPPTNSVRACPQRTQTAPIYSAQFRPSVRKRTKVARELRDPSSDPQTSHQWPTTPLACASAQSPGTGRCQKGAALAVFIPLPKCGVPPHTEYNMRKMRRCACPDSNLRLGR